MPYENNVQVRLELCGWPFVVASWIELALSSPSASDN
jgi:hypothetical protein